MPTSIDAIFEQRGLTVDQLAKRSGLNVERVLSIVNGRWLPSPKERQAIAAALDLAVADVDWGHSMHPRNVRYHRFGLTEDFS